MRKGIELPKETIEGMLSGASMFIVPVDNAFVENLENPNKSEYFMGKYSPLQIDDEFYVQEDFIEIEQFDRTSFMSFQTGLGKYPNVKKFLASQMTYDQSRLKDLVITGVEVKRVQDICAFDFFSDFSFEESNSVGGFNIIYEIGDEQYDETTICEYFDDFLHKQNISYEENPYNFICTFKKLNKDK